MVQLQIYKKDLINAIEPWLSFVNALVIIKYHMVNASEQMFIPCMPHFVPIVISFLGFTPK